MESGVTVFFKVNLSHEEGKFYLTIPQKQIGTNESFNLYCCQWGSMKPITFNSIEEGKQFLQNNDIFLRQNGNVVSKPASKKIFKIIH